MTKTTRIAVIGGGLGGTVAAILLQRAGYTVKVYEQAAGLARVGAGINLDPHAMRIMRGLGIERELTRIGRISETRYSREWDTGEITWDTPVSRYVELYGGNHFSIHRGDLQQVLGAQLAPDSVVLGKRLVDVEERGKVVHLSFADGETAEANLVIGADGINSRVRECLLGPERPTYMGRVAYRTVIPTERLRGLRPGDHVKWWGKDRSALTYYLTHARTELYFVASVPEPEWGASDYTHQEADMTQLRAALAGFHAEVQQVLTACTSATRWAVLERDPLPLWSRGRIVMLGDACHPMAHHMGQGAAMAFEDAVILVRCLAQVGPHEPETVFALYRQQRFERTSRMQKESARNNWLRHPMDPGWVFHYDAFTVPLMPLRSTH